ncbi:cytochrome P450 [Polaromonas sp.]|uniref:cytochrome P450 n=1 Tax=Polaromonas sp. TaxID=1869339 RepID=UPI00326650FA
MIAKLLKLDKPSAAWDTGHMQQPRNAIEAATHPDPWPFYRSLRQERPLFFDPGVGLWVASSHAAVSAALSHPALRVRPPAEPVPQALQGTSAGEVFAQLVRMTDGEFHAAHKPAVTQAARRWSLADVARAAEDAAGDLQPRLEVNDFLGALPVQAMARLLDVPVELRDDTCRWVGQFTQGIAPGADAQAVALADGAAAALMAQGRALGLPPTQAANRIAFMQQAMDAGAGLLGLTALQLTQEPEQGAAADTSQEAMRNFVREVERWAAPIQNTRRFAAEPLSLLGQPVEAGQAILLVLASANRDEAFNPQAERFDAHRAQGRSMGFGSGPHACPGALIAIEIVAACARHIRSGGQFCNYFGHSTGFRPLPNARIPVFAQ